MICIRIVSPPAGEAPQVIRDAWVGTNLRVANNSPTPVRVPVVGVLTGTQTSSQQVSQVAAPRDKNEIWEGFAVGALQAIEELEKSNVVPQIGGEKMFLRLWRRVKCLYFQAIAAKYSKIRAPIEQRLRSLCEYLFFANACNSPKADIDSVPPLRSLQGTCRYLVDSFTCWLP